MARIAVCPAPPVMPKQPIDAKTYHGGPAIHVYRPRRRGLSKNAPLPAAVVRVTWQSEARRISEGWIRRIALEMDESGS
jgi:hypothetical protein